MDMKKKIEIACMSVTAIFVASQKKSAFPREICNMYKAQYQSDPPWRELGFSDELSFLLEAGFKKCPDGKLSRETPKEASHVSEMLENQKSNQRTKFKTSAAPPARNQYRTNPMPSPPVRPVAVTNPLGVNDFSSGSSPPIVFPSDRELEAHCSKIFPPAFRHQLRMKLRDCDIGCSPEAFVEYFNRSNFERFKTPKDLELKGLSLMQFFRGLPDVFRVVEQDGVVKIFPALTSSLSLQTLGNSALSKPNTSDWMQRSCAVSYSSGATQDSKLLTVSDMIPFFKQAQEFFAGQEVDIIAYLQKVGDLGGQDAREWLEVRRFDAESFANFATEKLGTSINVDVGRAVVRIRSVQTRPERPPGFPVSPNERPVPEREPFSSAFTMGRLECGSGLIDIAINNFGPDTLNFYFSPVKASQRRLDLMKRLRTLEQKPLPRGKIEPGAACITSCEKNKIFYRASIRKVEGDFVYVYHVDFGDTVWTNHVFQIPDEFLKEGVFAHPGFLANVKPIDGKPNFELKELQELHMELDTSCVKATILSFDVDSHRYRVDLGETARELERNNLLVYAPEESISPVTNGFHSMRIQSNGNQQTVVSTIARQPTNAQTNGNAAHFDASKLRVENRVLPNCETVLLIRRDSTPYVLSSDISRVLGLPQNTFLATLEKLCIALTGSWELSPEVKKILDDGDHNIEHGTDNVVIPVVSAAPLMRAFLWAEGRSLDNEKNVLKAFEKMAN